MRNPTETMMIASDLKAAGFGVEVVPQYSAIRVYLTRKVDPTRWQVERALEQAGYEPCQYTITTPASVWVRAVVA